MKKECLFYDEKKYIIVEGNKISYKNYNICKNAVIDYIKQIKKFEKLVREIDENNENNITIIKQNEMEINYKELINDGIIIIKFSDSNNMDKLYVD